MSYRLDGMGREIQDILRIAGIIMAGAFQEKYRQPKFTENVAQEKWNRYFFQMIDAGKVNEAENELMEKLMHDKNTGTLDAMSLSMAFGVYEYMNEKGDDFLENNHYSREEILEGIKGVLSLGGMELP